MTTQILIINRGPKPIEVTGTLLSTPTEIQPHQHAEFWVHAGEPLQIEESSGVSTNLAGGSGDPD